MVDTHRIRAAAADPTSYLSAIRELSDPIEQETLLVDDFLLYRASRLAIYYAPFDHINDNAQVVLLGVTPGWIQMQLAFATVRDVLADGATHDMALEEVKRAAAFGGTMRLNLTRMVDGIGTTPIESPWPSRSVVDSAGSKDQSLRDLRACAT